MFRFTLVLFLVFYHVVCAYVNWVLTRMEVTVDGAAKVASRETYDNVIQQGFNLEFGAGC